MLTLATRCGLAALATDRVGIAAKGGGANTAAKIVKLVVVTRVGNGATVGIFGMETCWLSTRHRYAAHFGHRRRHVGHCRHVVMPWRARTSPVVDPPGR